MEGGKEGDRGGLGGDSSAETEPSSRGNRLLLRIDFYYVKITFMRGRTSHALEREELDGGSACVCMFVCGRACLRSCMRAN